MAIKVKNNAKSLLASGISDVATSLDVTAAEGAFFPVLSLSDYFYCTIQEVNKIEIVKVTARAIDTFTIIRAQDGSMAQTFSASAKVEIRWNVKQVSDLALLAVDIPAQLGNAGKFLKTSGTIMSWEDVDALPSQLSKSGKILSTNGTVASWIDPPATGLASLADGKTLVGNVLNQPVEVTLSGDVTMTNAGVMTVANASVIGKLITGFASGAGIVAATDSILAAIQKIVGNIAGKQDALGFTAEDVSNKDTTATLGISDTKYPSQKAVKTYVDTGLGTKQASGSYELNTNKENATLDTSTTKYPTNNLVKSYVDAIYQEDITANAFTGTSITPSTFKSKQLWTYTGSSVQVFTGFGTLATYFKHGQVITIMGSSDTNYCTINHNDVANGWLLNGPIDLELGTSIQFMFNSTLGRMVEISRNN